MGTIAISPAPTLGDPNPTQVQYPLYAPPTLAQVQGWVGGYVETVGMALDGTPPEPVQVFVNEDGLSMGLPPNPVATAEVKRLGITPLLPPGGFLLGTVVFLYGSDVQWV